MASIPVKGDRFLAKVEMWVFLDKECTAPYPPLPPGPAGLRKSWQYPGTRKVGEEVGTYTGISSEAGYEVDFILKYSRAEQVFFKWNYYDVIKLIKVWVKKDQVTGFWDKGVDAPKIEEDNTPPPPPDNTNLYLTIALAAAILLKFVLPQINKK